MSHLSQNQKKNLWILFGVTCVAGFIAGLTYLVVWVDETASVQRYCSGTTMVTLTTDNGGTQSASVTFDDPKCR